MINNQWEADFVGVLANNEDVQKKAIFINRENSIQFYLKIISNEPDSFPKNNVKTVTCFADNDLNYRWGFEDDLSKSDIEREDALIEFLEDSLVIFKPTKTGNSTKEFYVAKDINLIAKKEAFKDTTRLVPLPIFNEEPKQSQEIEQSKEEFRLKLIDGKHIGHNKHVSTEEEDTPELVAFRTNDKQIFLYGEFDSHTFAHGGFKLKPRSSVKEILLDETKFEEEIYKWQDILFIAADSYAEIFDELINTNEITISEEEKLDFNKTRLKGTNQQSLDKDDGDNEEEWLSYLKELAIQENLNFSQDDLYNFHTAMKTKRLVLLSGLSGTGKSRLVQLYAKALGAESTLNFISVSPSWTDDTDLLGFPDTLNNVYRPGDSGLVNTLIKANNDPENLYIICFDEMNLARVEHYFSQFLSVLEMEERRILKLYNADLENRFYNSEQYNSQIKVGSNILFVGTVNIDESTYHFSDKVLDRSNVIELEIKPYSELLEFSQNKDTEKLKEIRNKLNEFPITTTNYNSFTDIERNIKMSKGELGILWDIHIELYKANNKFGIGPRVVKHIDQYLKNIPADAPFSREQGLDLQITQRILTKLRGIEEVMQNLVGTYDEDLKSVSNSTLLDILNDSDYNFERSKRIIEQKAKELYRNGFAL